MTDQIGEPKDPTHPCPICKQEGDNVLFLKANQVMKQLTPIQQKSILSLPKAVEVLVLITDLFLCRTCGVRYEKIRDEQKGMMAAQYTDEQGRPIDPAALGAGR